MTDDRVTRLVARLRERNDPDFTSREDTAAIRRALPTLLRLVEAGQAVETRLRHLRWPPHHGDDCNCLTCDALATYERAVAELDS